MDRYDRSRLIGLIGLYLCLAVTAGCSDGLLETPSTTTERESQNRADSPFTRRDAPPEGVSPQFEWPQEGDGDGADCPDHRQLSITPVFVEGRALDRPEILGYFELCFPGFSVQQPISLEMTGPSGKKEELRVDALPGAPVQRFLVLFLPSDEPGRYTLVARQGSRRQARTGITLRRATTPRLRIIEGRTLATAPFRLGSTITLAIAGHKARQIASIHIYRAGSKSKYLYNTTLKVPTDNEGEAIYRLRTKRTDPPGCYTVIMQPGDVKDIICLTQ